MKISNKDLQVGMFLVFGDRKNLIVDVIKNMSFTQAYTIQESGQKSYGYYYHNQDSIILEDSELEKKYRQANLEYKRNIGFSKLYSGVNTVGSDPECFVVDKHDKVIPSYLFLKSKEENDKTMKTNEAITKGATSVGSGVQSIFWDGFQAEFNVYASNCLSWTVDSTFIGLKTLLKKAREYNPDAKLSLKTVVDIDADVLNNALPEHVAFGCMPSFNAYGMTGIKEDGRKVPFRSTGGHIHLGLDNTNHDKNVQYVKALDKILGVACVSLFAKYDDPRRRIMYGLAGEYRTPAHGIEYRSLSNAWLSHPLIMNIVFELSRRCISTVREDVIQYWDSTEEETISCINNCDVELAREILARNKKQFIQIFESIRQGSGLAIYKMFMLGMESVIENPDDIESNWKLDNGYIGHCETVGFTIKTMNTLTTYNPLLEEQVTTIYEELVVAIQGIEITTEPEEQKQLTA